MAPRLAVALLAALLAAAARADVPDAAALRAAAGGTPLPSTLAPQRLHDYFANGSRTLDLFCAAGRSCRDGARRRSLYTLFFRDGFARPVPAPALAEAADAASASDSVASAAARPVDADAAYASQATAYFTEPGYACRRPLTARVLETLWQLPPAVASCSPTVPFLVNDSDGRTELREIAPGRVAAVHLLYAGETGSGMSSFGHVSLRLVVCAAARTRVDEGCDEDLDEHLAIGFRAAVDEFRLSLRKGITGGYPLRLFAEPFMTLYDLYTVREFRPLTSLPLRLDAAERELLVKSLAEVHWSYDNDYRFFSHNCASELSWLLRVVSQVAGAEPPWLAGPNRRPDRLFRRARASAAFDNPVLADLRQAEHDGFYFPASAPYFQQALDAVAQRATAAGRVPPVHDFESFRALDAATRRNLFYEPALAAPTAVGTGATTAAAATNEVSTRTRAAHGALVLEAWMERRAYRELLAVLAHYYLGMTQALLARTDYFTPDERLHLARCLRGLARPLALGSSDGLPVAPFPPEPGCDLSTPVMQATLERLFALAPPPAREERQIAELRNTVDTVNWLVPQADLPFLSPSPHDGDRP